MPTRKPTQQPAAVGASAPPPPNPAGSNSGGPSPRVIRGPVFAQPEATADPATFRTKHPSDNAAYNAIDKLNAEHKIFPLQFDPPRGGTEPQLTLLDVFGGNSTAIDNITKKNRQIVFHATGDCGSTVGPKTETLVTDKMVSDFNETDPKEVPQFALLLGDIVYSFGEAQYYYDQFYEPYRNYPAPVLAAAGNHDGMVSPLAGAKSLQAYLRNFCDDTYEKTGKFTVCADAGALSRTAQIQPGVFFTFEAPFIRILVIYSNTLEDPGVVADPKTIGATQLDYLTAALTRVKDETFAGALIIADHHPPFTAAGSRHGWSVDMLAQIDKICGKVGVWPHAFLSGHAHNYQRFTRTRSADGTQIPYIVCGNGGHGTQTLTKAGDPPLRAPQILQAKSPNTDQIVLENYDAAMGHFGYLRVVVDSAQLRIEYHPASDGPSVKTPDDAVTVDLASRMLTHYVANDLGQTKAAQKIRTLRAKK